VKVVTCKEVKAQQKLWEEQERTVLKAIQQQNEDRLNGQPDKFKDRVKISRTRPKTDWINTK
jgi:hypothetical protein